MPDTSPQPSTGVEPSAEAVERAHWKLGGVICDFNEDTGRYEPLESVAGYSGPDEEGLVREVIAAAYRIDAPAIHAAGVVEGRAAMQAALDRAIETRENANAVSSRLEAERPRLIAGAEARGRAAMRDVLQAAREALMPFAGCDTQDDHAPRRDDEWPPMRERIKDWFSWDDFRAAVEARDAIEAAFPTTGEKTDG